MIEVVVAPVQTRLRARVMDYVALTKPRIMVLLLITAVSGAFAGAGGVPALTTVLAVVAGGALASGGASALNHVVDRDLDGRMRRTRGRPVASERVSVGSAVTFGVVLSGLSFVVLGVWANGLAAWLAVAGNGFYVAVYSMWLKRATPQNIVIGGAAGAVPPLVGFAAAAGRIDATAVWLFAIVFLWTPAHFWALALLLRDDYATAGVPMLPVVRGERATVRAILGYAVAVSVATLLPVGWREFGPVYASIATVSDAWLLWLAWRLARDPSRRRAGRLFHASLAYLAALFVAVAAGSVVVT